MFDSHKRKKKETITPNRMAGKEKIEPRSRLSELLGVGGRKKCLICEISGSCQPKMFSFNILDPRSSVRVDMTVCIETDKTPS